MKKLTTEEFIIKAREVHGEKYDYSKVNYLTTMEKVCIICPKHGEFWQTPNSHLHGKGCPKCGVKKCIDAIKSTKEEFLIKAKEVHGNKYDYSKVEYINNKTKICIICPIHGEFWQVPNSHLSENGCPKCMQSKLEKKCSNFLTEHNIKFDTEKTFMWLGNQRIDFYLMDYNAAIECQGLQHFEAVDYYGGLKELRTRQKRDCKKYNKCNEHGIDIFYFTFPKIFRNVKPSLNIYDNNLFTDLETIFSLIAKKRE